MSEAKFTKVEWCFVGLTADAFNDIGANQFSALIEGNFNKGADQNELEANAHLIAAAPEMYDLLERLTNHDNCKKDIIHLLGEADNLLSKARGEK